MKDREEKKREGEAWKKRRNVKGGKEGRTSKRMETIGKTGMRRKGKEGMTGKKDKGGSEGGRKEGRRDGKKEGG